MVDTTVVQVMVPDLVLVAEGNLDQALWAVNGFVLTYAALLITAGRLGGLRGPRTLLLAGLVVFAMASLACGLSSSVAQLIAARLAQGVGGALIVPQSLTIIATVFPKERRGVALGVISATMALAAIIGPVGGGLIVSTWGWRWVFLVNVPICVVAMALTLVWVPNAAVAPRQALDWPGVALATAGLAAITYSLIGRSEFGSVFAVAGALLLVLFVWWERRYEAPLMPTVLFRQRAFSIAGWLACVQFLVLSGLMLVVSLHVRGPLAGSVIDTALAFLPMAVMAGLVSPFAGAITDRVGGRLVIIAGQSAMGIGVAGFAVLAAEPAPLALLALPLGLVGCGVGLVMAPASAEAVNGLPPALVPAASGVLNTGRQVAGLLGVAITGALLQTGPSAGPGVLGGTPTTIALSLLAGIALVAAASGWLLRARPAQSEVLPATSGTS
ncbi:MFS transporter [Streptosporangium sp. CA-115845]|uniref:MFS transporter n=1 Tax=Streptosporangium sp. CA-115845 TaxID=3240071 RepID=UPI003D8BAF0F